MPRSQCPACPWRDLSDPAIDAAVLGAARAGAEFVCHTRMGPCPGPALAGVAPPDSSEEPLAIRGT